jgi:hypothetical protein
MRRFRIKQATQWRRKAEKAPSSGRFRIEGTNYFWTSVTLGLGG